MGDAGIGGVAALVLERYMPPCLSNWVSQLRRGRPPAACLRGGDSISGSMAASGGYLRWVVEVLAQSRAQQVAS